MREGGKRILVATAGLAAFACAHSAPSVKPVLQPAAPKVTEADPIVRLIAMADAHLARGLAEGRAGHLNQARGEFDKALEVYLTVPGGARANPRIANAYQRTLETIQLHEFEALAAGDGFIETPSEPASIDAVSEIPLGEAEPTEESRRVAEEAVKEEAPDVPILLNDQVLACIDLYQGPLRDWFGEALNRGGRYLPHIREVFAAEGIPQDLAYVALVESAFKTGALSRAKAKGVWQFISATGKRFGLAQDWWVDERSDPEKATRAAASYLKQLHQMFQDWNLALAAYNAGEGKVQRGINRYGTSDFWELAKTRAFKRETKNYVPMIHAAIVVAKAPERYGFTVDPQAAPAYDMVAVDGAVDLRVVAECGENQVADIRELNPELRRLATPAKRSFALKVPAGAGDRIAACLASLPVEKRVTFRTHLVARGETLSSVARLYGSRVKDIAEANGLSPKRRLSRGTELIIPVRDAGRAATSAPRQVRNTVEPKLEPRASGASERVRISYTIKAGDTLATIASRYNTTVRELQAWNSLRGSRIAAGNTLTVYTRRAD
ncbi:MAG TPA: transglycosylase SLT domain-containing protein [Vicinamibacteria bacterium]|nr:transglycosylase SLT domain-containing protein [Vicinamibacteria bacterium]